MTKPEKAPPHEKSFNPVKASERTLSNRISGLVQTFFGFGLSWLSLKIIAGTASVPALVGSGLLFIGLLFVGKGVFHFVTGRKGLVT